MMTNPLRPSTLILAFGLLAAGCGGTEAPAADAPPEEEVAATASAPADTPRPLADATVPADLGADLPPMIVFKSPTCGCCNAWIDHLEAHAFQVEPRDTPDMASVKMDVGLPSSLASCHTGIVDGYVIEGHVPAEAIARLLAERPEGVAGLAVPGMPVGSPGMEGPNPEPYTVYAFDRAGNATVFMEIDPR